MQSAKEMTCDAVLALLIARSVALEWCALLAMVGEDDGALKDAVECTRTQVDGVTLPQIDEKFLFSGIRRLKSDHCQVHEYSLAVRGLAALADPAAVDMRSLTIGLLRRGGDWQVGDFPERRTPLTNTIVQLRGVAHAAGLVGDLTLPLSGLTLAIQVWLVRNMQLSAGSADDVPVERAIALLEARTASSGEGGPDSLSIKHWITNKEAAKLLAGPEEIMPIDQAESRVSRAGKAGAFETNGERGRTKRISQTSFFPWLLKERKRILDGVDARL